MGLAKFVLRTTVGGIIVGHGLQKLNGSFEGPGPEGTKKMVESLGLHPAKYQAWAVALSETLGGGLTAAGFLSPLGPSMIIGSQVVAINKVHLKNGFWSHKGGYEYNLTLIAAALAVAELGPGALSLDRVFGKRRSGFGWALASAGLALGAAAATLKVAEKSAPKEHQDGDGSRPASAPGAGAATADRSGVGAANGDASKTSTSVSTTGGASSSGTASTWTGAGGTGGGASSSAGSTGGGSSSGTGSDAPRPGGVTG
jgi:putative oxidoreductase